jgi:hypothetical protein
MGKKTGAGSGMNNPDHISESLETTFLGVKYLNSVMQIRDGKNSNPVDKTSPIRNTVRTCGKSVWRTPPPNASPCTATAESDVDP